MRVALIISACTQVLPLAALLTFIIRRVKINNDYKYCVYYFAANFLFQVICTATAIHSIPNLWLSHFYYPFQFFCLGFILVMWERDYERQLGASVLIISVVLYAMQILVESMHSFAVYSIMLQYFFLFFLSLRIMFLLTDRSITYTKFWKDGRFWFTIAVEFNSALMLVIAVMLNSYSFALPYLLNAIINLATNLIYTWGVICYYFQRSPYSRSIQLQSSLHQSL